MIIKDQKNQGNPTIKWGLDFDFMWLADGLWLL